MAKQQWHEVGYHTAAMPIPGLGVVVRYTAYRSVISADFRADDVPVSVSTVFVPGAALRPALVDGKVQLQVVDPGPGNQKHVGGLMPGCEPDGQGGPP